MGDIKGTAHSLNAIIVRACFIASILHTFMPIKHYSGVYVARALFFDQAALANTAHRMYSIYFKPLNVDTGVLYVIYGTRGVVELPIQHEAKPSAV